MRTRRSLSVLAVLVFVAVAPGRPAAGPATLEAARAAPTTPRGADLITAAQLRDYLTFLSADELEGRDTPSRGLDTAARFLATTLARLGLEPAGDSGYFQRMAMTERKVDPARATVVLGERTFGYGDEFIASAPGRAEAPLVYVGHGHVVTKKGIDAYRGIDVRGKILVANAGLPEGVTRADLKGEAGEAWQSPATYAAAHGAVAVVLVPGFAELSNWSRDRLAAIDRGTVVVDRMPSSRTPKVPVVTASPTLLTAIFEGERLTAAEAFARADGHKGGDSFALNAQKVLRLDVASHDRVVSTQNVVAVWRGSDPRLKDEYVALGAHYDHVGRRLDRRRPHLQRRRR